VRARLACRAALLFLAGRIEATWVDDFAAWLPVQAKAQEQTEAMAIAGQGFTEIAKTVGKEGLVGNWNTASSFIGVPTALLSGDVDGAMEEAANAALSTGVVFVTSTLGGMVGGPLAPLTSVAGALFGGFVYRQSGIEDRIRGHFQRSSDERSSENVAKSLDLRRRLPQVREACEAATRLVVDARGLIHPPGGAGSEVDDLFGAVGDVEAAVQALGGRIEGSGLIGVRRGAGDEAAIIGQLADLEWIAGEACRIADQAASTDFEGARRVWEAEGRFLAGRIESRSAAVLARIDQAEQALRAAAAERASQRGEVERLTAAVDSLAARIRSARESAAGASALLDRAGRLLDEAAASLADCVRFHSGLKGLIERVSLGQISSSGELRDLVDDLALIHVPAGSHRELLDELSVRRASAQRSVSYLDGYAGTAQSLRASLDRWRSLLSAADVRGFSPAQARSEAEADRRRAESCRGRAEALASGRSSPTGAVPSVAGAASGVVSVPDLFGKSRAMAEAWLGDLNLRPVVSTGVGAPTRDEAGKVASQTYPAGSSLPKGSFVGVTVWGAHEPAETTGAVAAVEPGPGRARTQADCTRDWPGTVLTPHPVTGSPSCQCPSGSAWSKVSRACLALPAGMTGGIAGAVAGGDCRHMPGTMRDSRTGECRCAIGVWDASLGRCVDTAAAAREADVAGRRKAADCENLFSRIKILRSNPDALSRNLATLAESEARALGCDSGRIAEATGGGAGGGSDRDSPVVPVTGPVEDKHEGEARVSSRNVNVCIIDVNDVLDDHYELFVNGGHVGGVANPEGGATCYGIVLRGGPNDLVLKLVATRGKNTFLKISINNDEFSGSFGGSKNHVWRVMAP